MTKKKLKPTRDSVRTRIGGRLSCIVEEAGRRAGFREGWNLYDLTPAKLRVLESNLPHGPKEIARLEDILARVILNLRSSDETLAQITHDLLASWPKRVSSAEKGK